jgi:peptidoglycan hydrolase-like protein with peptidoglycan-binding domain
MRTSQDGIEPGAGVPGWARLAVATTVVVVAALLAGCSSSSSSSSSSTTTAAPTTTTSGALSPAAVRALQVALAAVGCYAGSVDGVVGPATTKAVRAFQAADGLTVDGVYGSRTRTKLVAAAAAGTRVCAAPPTTTTTTAAATTTTAAAGQAAAIVAAVNAWMAANGPKAGTWELTSTALSTVDPTYALFRIGPAPGYENSVQGGYGFVHQSGGTWGVIGFGSAGVGCPPGTASYPAVPLPVLTGFGLTCPTS